MGFSAADRVWHSASQNGAVNKSVLGIQRKQISILTFKRSSTACTRSITE